MMKLIKHWCKDKEHISSEGEGNSVQKRSGLLRGNKITVVKITTFAAHNARVAKLVDAPS